jgi:uncharacterized damage-inducible protein DinB
VWARRCIVPPALLLHDHSAHKGHADAAMLQAIRQHPPAASDPDVRTLLHHMLVANRFWLLALVGEPFAIETETRLPASFADLVTGFRATHERESLWTAGLTDADLSQMLEHPHIPGGRCRVSDALLQVCLHSQGHRSQIAKMLRALGGTPPMTDFILWRIDRPLPGWPDGRELPIAAREGA